MTTITLKNYTAGGYISAGPQPLTVNMSGTDGVNLSAFNWENQVATPVTVNLAALTKWSGGMSNVLDTETVNGPKSATFLNNTGSRVSGGTTTLNVPLAGTGEFDIGPWHGSGGGTLNLNATVGSGQTINVEFGAVNVAHAADFHGLLILGGYGYAELGDLAKANSYSFKNDMLTIFGSNGKALDLVRVESGPGLQVEKTACGSVVASFGWNGGIAGVALPVHA